MADKEQSASHRWFKTPNSLIDNMGTLGISGWDLAILLKIASHKYGAKKQVFLMIDTIAISIGLDRSNVCRRLQCLEADGLLKRTFPEGQREHHLATIYSLDPLWEKIGATDLPVKRGKKNRKKPEAAFIDVTPAAATPEEPIVNVALKEHPSQGVVVDGEHYTSMAEARRCLSFKKNSAPKLKAIDNVIDGMTPEQLRAQFGGAATNTIEEA